MQTEVLVDGLRFPEGPRWREGWLYFSDMHDDAVKRVAPETGRCEVVVELSHPSGLGWLPDGRMLIVSMEDRRVMRLESDRRLVVHADLGDIATAQANDMVVDEQGRAWVGNFGAAPDPESWPHFEPVPAALALVMPDGRAREGGGLVRLREGGELAGEVETRRTSYACMLGGSDGCTLFACTADSAVPEACRAAPRASIETVRVEAARAGFP